ncbi:exodeoxyribonuclease VII large subunit [Barnesiella viscericola]|uniref:exodeoxyribonuclease VII large subunit n=1 Tax=Barnesiella viscericola TaxID=397865 RepID=UPI00255B68EB|nr:exodeoxyribonuclease VII large subunit [Barnesiella viscericola]
MSAGRKEFSLLELNARVRDALQEALPERYWVRAEVSEARIHPSGHCYLELIEKEEHTGRTVAKARATIWATTFRLLRPWFEQSTGQLFTSGIKILVLVSPVFHELYGYSLTIHDIDPTYTLGDAARRRAAILQQLRDEGVADMNKELVWPPLPQRFAIISSPSAAGYGDFMNQLQNNPYGYRVYTALFPASMQGEQTERSIIEALDRIASHEELFDGVVIIRGGGATSDLNSFDSYPLAANVAQFPLPVITGIGHERDDTVIDLVANTRVKTPTAAAEWIIARLHEADLHVAGLSLSISEAVRDRLQREKQTLQRTTSALPMLVERRILNERHKSELWLEQIKHALRSRLDAERSRLDQLATTVELVSPQSLLQRGYSLTLHQGRVVKSVTDLAPGETIETLLADGSVVSRVETTQSSKTK